MPKPILSDSLFNADDVATAILNKANLQIASSSLGVTDVTSSISASSGWSIGSQAQAYTFNGFVFIQWRCVHSGGTPSEGEVFMQVTDSSIYPLQDTEYNTISYLADSAFVIRVKTNGNFEVHSPHNITTASNSDYHLVFGGMWRFA